jgi:hypothetical protein
MKAVTLPSLTLPILIPCRNDALNLLAVAWDQHLIAEPEGPSFISRTVARR